jgi:hypothetical protein
LGRHFSKGIFNQKEMALATLLVIRLVLILVMENYHLNPLKAVVIFRQLKAFYF